MNENNDIRYCKNCGCELMSTNKKNLCENCRRSRNNNIKKGVFGIGGAVAAFTIAIFTGGKGGVIKKK